MQASLFLDEAASLFATGVYTKYMTVVKRALPTKSKGKLARVY